MLNFLFVAFSWSNTSGIIAVLDNISSPEEVLEYCSITAFIQISNFVDS